MAHPADEILMRPSLELAVLGRGRVEPNPMVGCVIARDGRVLGEGWHQRFGEAHAEINALAACREDPAGATAYVTLEPCCHTNKKTPPCTPRLIGAKLARVVVGTLDPNPPVNGQGVAMLRQAGIEVMVGVLEAECRQMIAPFIARVLHGRPYVTLKWAVSADGQVAGRQGRPVQITGAAATAAVHGLRGRCDAIAIGTNTLVNDDPLLTSRTPGPLRRPIRVVFSNSLNFPPYRRLFGSLDDGPVLIYCAERAASGTTAERLRASGVEVVALPATDNTRGGSRFAMGDAYADLYHRGVTHLLVEPGPKLATELMARNQADRAWVFHGQVEVEKEGLAAPDCPWPETGRCQLQRDTLVEYLNPDSACTFARVPSADLFLASSSGREVATNEGHLACLRRPLTDD